MELLAVKNLKMYYKTLRGEVKAVDDVSFRLEQGRALGLAGESGCGKSSMAVTLLRLLPSNGRITGGTVRFGGVDTLAMTEEEFRKEIRWKKISIIFQGAMNALNPVLRIGDQITEAIINAGAIPKPEAVAQTKELLAMVGIEPGRYGEYPHEFSGGMKQRVVIAMALACRPALVIADEPTTALDVMVQAQVLTAMEKLRKKFNLSMILISHDLSVIAQSCDDIAVMYAGKIVEYGEAVEIYKNPCHPYTRGLLGAFPDITAERSPVKTIPGYAPNLLEPPAGCRFHPRCPLAVEECRRLEPALKTVRPGNNRVAACHRMEEACALKWEAVQ